MADCGCQSQAWCRGHSREAVVLIQHTKELWTRAVGGQGKSQIASTLEVRGDACCVHVVPEEGDGGGAKDALLWVDDVAMGIQATENGAKMKHAGPGWS